MSSPIYGSTTALTSTTNWRTPLSVGGLEADTAYYWKVDVGGALLGGGQMRTSSSVSKSFKLIAGSCDRNNGGQDVFDRISAKSPELFIHMGDWHYADINTNDVSLFRAAWDGRILTDTGADKRRGLYAKTSMAYMWDDHDYGANNSSGNSASRPASVEAMRQHVSAPYELSGSSDGTYYSFIYNGLRIIMSDLRSLRTDESATDNASKTMMGATQKAWWKSEIQEAKTAGQPVVWITTMPYVGTTGDDGWHLYTTERQELADFIIAEGMSSRMFAISGDAHMVAADDGTNVIGGFPIVHGAGLTSSASTKGGPYSHGSYGDYGQYADIDVTYTSGVGWDFSYVGRGRADESRVAMTWSITQWVQPPQQNPPPQQNDTGIVLVVSSQDSGDFVVAEQAPSPQLTAPTGGTFGVDELVACSVKTDPYGKTVASVQMEIDEGVGFVTWHPLSDVDGDNTWTGSKALNQKS